MSKVAERVGVLEEAMVELANTTASILAAIREDIAEIRAAIREDVAEIRASNARTDRQLLAMQQQADKDRQQADLDRQRADLDRERAEKERKDFNKRLAEITDAQGLLIENMVWPNLRRIAGQVLTGGVVHFQAIRLHRLLPGDPSQMMELDLIAVGEREILVCEAKSKVSASKVTDFLESLARLGEFFPEYAGHRLLPAIASIYLDPGVVKFMTSRGVLAIGFGDETMELLNPEAATRRA